MLMNTDQPLSKSVLFLFIGTAAILMIPLISMQFTTEVIWTLSDYILAAVLIFGTGFTYLFVTTKSHTTAYNLAVGSALGTGFLLIWSNLAVGIIGSEDNVINLFYFGVIAIGIIGAMIVRFKAEGMVITLIVMALAQALIAVVATIGGYYQSPPSSVMQILGVNAFFVGLWIVSALLFRRVVTEEAQER